MGPDTHGAARSGCDHWFMSRWARRSLLSRVLATNALLLVTASAILLLSPATVSSPVSWGEVFVLGIGTAAFLVVNALILRRAFAPLERLTRLMSRVDPVTNTERLPIYGDDREVAELTAAFNDMLDRLRSERRESVRRSLEAQEGERHRVAQELHDEIGQSLTAMLLQIERVNRARGADLDHELAVLRGSIRESLDDLRRIAQRLRPELLDDLGLSSALLALADRVEEQTELRIVARLDADLRGLSSETELVVYRVAQEALTNALRHAGAQTATLTVSDGADGSLVIAVSDDGRGLNGYRPGAGIAGMRERALLVGADLSVQSKLGAGTEVRLTIPAATRR
jgi:two-component system sensor histidine kinase UhpB